LLLEGTSVGFADSFGDLQAREGTAPFNETAIAAKGEWWAVTYAVEGAAKWNCVDSAHYI
jgi:hypothetical protein